MIVWLNIEVLCWYTFPLACSWPGHHCTATTAPTGPSIPQNFTTTIVLSAHSIITYMCHTFYHLLVSFLIILSRQDDTRKICRGKRPLFNTPHGQGDRCRRWAEVGEKQHALIHRTDSYSCELPMLTDITDVFQFLKHALQCTYIGLTDNRNSPA